jgi:hypothetical protein
MRMLAMALMMMPLAGCGMSVGDDTPGITGTGAGGTRSYAASGFTGVVLAGSDDVDVAIGPNFTVRAEGAAADLDRLRIRVKDGNLVVDRRRQQGISMGGRDVTVHVTMPRFTDAAVAGSGTLSAARAEGDRFNGRLAGSGDLRLPAMAVGDAKFEIAGSGTVTAAGTARALDIAIAGSGGVDAPGLRATSADIKVAGSGGVRAAVAGPATVKIMGSGDVDLGPQARCTSKKMGSGSVRCG